MADFAFALSLDAHGSGNASIVAHEQALTMDFSYLSDSLALLTEAAVLLFKSPALDKVIVSWQQEPGEYQWVLYPEDKNVRMQILHFGECFSRLPDMRGQCLFKATCTVMRFATQVKEQMHQMLNKYGEADYEARWRRPFPKSSFCELQALIHNAKHALVSSQP